MVPLRKSHLFGHGKLGKGHEGEVMENDWWKSLWTLFLDLCSPDHNLIWKSIQTLFLHELFLPCQWLLLCLQTSSGSLLPWPPSSEVWDWGGHHAGRQTGEVWLQSSGVHRLQLERLRPDVAHPGRNKLQHLALLLNCSFYCTVSVQLYYYCAAVLIVFL